MKPFSAVVLLALACASSAPKPAPQNPSPMADNTRVHERAQERPLAGKQFTVDGVLPKPVEVLITPAAANAKQADLVIHFLGASWLPMQAAEDSGRPLVIASVNLGAGSARYSLPFRDATVFPRLVERIKAQSPPIRATYLSGFSAGYGAIREILTQQPDAIDGVLLIDGLHTSYVPEGKVVAEGGRLDESKLAPFLRYAGRAVRGEKRFVFTHSEIFPGTFASTTETADYLLHQLGIKRTPVVQWGPRGMQQLSEARRGSFAILGFAGNSGPDHIDQLHSLSSFLPMLFESPFESSSACTGAKEKDVCAELLAIEQRDQAVRTAAMSDRQNVALIAEMNRIDREDLARVEAIIAKHGWPGKSLVGPQAAKSAWLVIQHADVASQKKYIDMMMKAADAGELDRGLPAMTVDRILVAEGKPQTFGSAFKEVNRQFVPEPIADEANVDARRKAVGLPPMTEYSAQLKEAYARPPQEKKATTLVARVWRGRVPTSRADEYAKYLYDNGPVKIRAVPGNLGAEMLRRTDGDVTEFIVISYWPSREAIKAFAGADIEKARFLPRDREFLIDPDEFVRHYDLTSPP